MKTALTFLAVLILSLTLGGDKVFARSADMLTDMTWVSYQRPRVPSDGRRGADMFSGQPALPVRPNADLFDSQRIGAPVEPSDMFRHKSMTPPDAPLFRDGAYLAPSSYP